MVRKAKVMIKGISTANPKIPQNPEPTPSAAASPTAQLVNFFG